MGRIADELGPLAVSRLVEPGYHFVGGVPGLALQVLPSGGRSWVLRVMVAGKRREIGLGGYPGVTLADARAAARTKRGEIKLGVDPVEQSRAVASKLKADRAAAVTFDQCAARFIRAHAPTWRNPKHKQQFVNTLAQYVTPVFGGVLVRDVEVSHVLLAVEPIWSTKTETAKRLRGRIELVLDWAAARGFREGVNPARWRGHLDKVLPKPSKVSRVKHHPALPVGLVGAFMASLRKREGSSARCVEFAIMTAARSGEARGARWGEIDLEAAVWICPPERMKAGTEHRVPLSAPAVELLRALPRMATIEVVFPVRSGDQLSDMALSMLIRRMNADDGGRWVEPKTGRCVVPHGFRSTFRDWASERTHYPRELAEVALAHTVAGKTEAAYWRGDLLAKRRQMMEDWALLLAEPALPS